MAGSKKKATKAKKPASARSTKGSGRTIGEYMKSLEAGRRHQLQELRSWISDALPEAKETMSYGMPTWEIAGEKVCAAASQKSYLALYFCELPVLDRHRDAFSHLDVGKSCIRFRELDALPHATLKKMLREAQRDVAARA